EPHIVIEHHTRPETHTVTHHGTRTNEDICHDDRTRANPCAIFNDNMGSNGCRGINLRRGRDQRRRMNTRRRDRSRIEMTGEARERQVRIIHRQCRHRTVGGLVWRTQYGARTGLLQIGAVPGVGEEGQLPRPGRLQRTESRYPGIAIAEQPGIKFSCQLCQCQRHDCDSYFIWFMILVTSRVMSVFSAANSTAWRVIIRSNLPSAAIFSIACLRRGSISVSISLRSSSRRFCASCWRERKSSILASRWSVRLFCSSLVMVKPSFCSFCSSSMISLRSFRIAASFDFVSASILPARDWNSEVSAIAANVSITAIRVSANPTTGNSNSAARAILIVFIVFILAS